MGNEACERFSLYGMNAILVVYLTDFLGRTAQDAKLEFHALSQVGGPAALFGAWLADRYLGKYRAIVLLSLLCCLGHLILAMRGTDSSWFVTGVALVFFGAGAAKPNISSHAGDQFAPDEADLLGRLFSIFYFAINFGAFFSTLLTPWLLAAYGPHVAFGVPGVLMLVATVIFMLGRNLYRKAAPAGGGDVFRIFGILIQALWRWQPRAEAGVLWKGPLGKYSAEEVAGVRSLGSVFKVFFPVSVYWALFGQMSSSWTIQAAALDLNFAGLSIHPAQVKAANPILVMLLIPAFHGWIFPALEKRGIRLLPVRRMTWGMILAAISFLLVAGLQVALDGGAQPSVLWQVLPYIVLTASEILVSVTGLEFAYSLAPPSMKSTVMSLWQLTGMMGNTIATVVVGLNKQGPLAEFLLYSGLMFGAALALHGIFRGRPRSEAVPASG